MDMFENNVICEATESDWLDVSYSKRYVDDAKEPKKIKLSKIKLKKPSKTLVAVLACVLALATLFVVSGGGVLTTARSTYLSVLDVFDGEQNVVGGKIAIPSNLSLVNVTDGVATFNGGRALLSFTSGKVNTVGEGTVTVDVDDKTQIVYTNLGEIFVAEGDVLTAGSLVARYGETVGASLVYDGQIVDKLVGSSSELGWSV